MTEDTEKVVEACDHDWRHCFTELQSKESKDKPQEFRTLWVCFKCKDYQRSVGQKKYFFKQSYVIEDKK